MERTPQSKRAEHARHLRRQGEFIEAATFYAAAAHGWLLRSRPLPEEDVGNYSLSHFGYAMQDFSAATLCCRLGGEDEWGRKYCLTSINSIEILLNNNMDFSNQIEGPERGLFHELIGDFSLIGDIGNPMEYYRNAETIYRDVDNPRQWQAESEFHSAIQIALELANSVEYELSMEESQQIKFESLTKRISFKKEKYPDIIHMVLQDGNWDSDLI